VISSRREAGPESAPSIPQLGQRVRALAEHRDQFAEGQVAGRSRQVFVCGHGHLAPQVAHLAFARERAQAHRVEARVGECEGEVALGRDPIVHPATKPVESIPERGQGAGDLPSLGPGHEPPEWMIGREFQRRCLDAVGEDGLDKRREGQLPAATVLRIVAAHLGDDVGHGRSVAPEQAEDARRAGAAERDRRSFALVRMRRFLR